MVLTARQRGHNIDSSAALPIQIHNEAEVARILPIAAKHGVPVTFRAAGTSLSGQAVTDSVLLKLSHTGNNFRRFSIPVRCRDGSYRPGHCVGWCAPCNTMLYVPEVIS